MLGKGSYGAVTKRDGYAIKKFNKLSHLTQEYMALRYLRDSKNIIRGVSNDLEALETTMKLYNTSLRKWIDKNGKTSTKTKMVLAHDIIVGLAEIHEKSLVHGDIKPGNILLEYENGDSKHPRALIGDLGFVSVAPYSKVERTAVVYRDTVIVNGPEHDMYSYGIVLLEMFADLKIYRQLEYKELAKLINKEVEDRRLKELILSLTNADHSKRPSAIHVLRHFFKDNDFEARRIKKPDTSDLALDDKHKKKISGWMKETAKTYNIHRAERGYKAVAAYLVDNKVSSSEYHMYAASMMFILSSVFGKSGFSEKHVESSCLGKCHMKDIYQAINKMISSDLMIRILLAP